MWLQYALMILDLIGVVEKVYSNIKGKGSVKKESVMSVAKTIATDMTAVSTGGQKDTWESIQPMVSAFVDTAVTIANVVSPGMVTDEEFEKRKAGLTP